MKLRRALSKKGFQIEVLKDDDSNQWIPLSRLNTLDEISQRFHKNDLTTNMLSVLELGTEGWQLLSEQIHQSTFVMTESDALAVLPFHPVSFRDFLLFEQHFIDASRGFVKYFFPQKHKITSFYENISGKTFPKFKPPSAWYQQPLYYFGNHTNFITSGTDIHRPTYTQALDYELELGAILAKPLLNATPYEAENAIGGYVVLNDLSARDVQFSEMRSGFGPQKAKHFLNAISPIVVTADEINNRVHQLQASVAINNVQKVRCTTENMQYSLGEAIAYASKSEQLHPGELFGSGTLPGGCGMENGFWIQDNSILSLKIDMIGDLTNKITF